MTSPTSELAEADVADAATTAKKRLTALVNAIWRTLLRPSLLISVSVFTLLLIGAALLLPQMPDQLADEPAAAARWLMTTASNYGTTGLALRSFGLFDVLNSLLFRVALSALTLITAAHFADSLGQAITVNIWTRRFCTSDHVNEPSSLNLANIPLYRLRKAINQQPEVVADFINKSITDSSDQVVTCPADLADQSGFRMLSLRNGSSFWIKPLLPLALLCIASVVWIYLLFGWELRTPLIAPGETYRAPSRGLTVIYDLANNESDLGDIPIIVTQLGMQSYTATVRSDVRTKLDTNQLAIDVAAPGLLIRVANGEPLLQSPGESTVTESVGVVLPSPGSEEAVLLPSTSQGLRIVRRTDDPVSFIAELYHGADLLPQKRVDISGQTSASAGESNSPIMLEFTPLPGIQLSVRHLPGTWLVWFSGLFLLVGAYSLFRQPAIVATQTTSWPEQRAVVTLQATRQQDLSDLEQILDESFGQESG